MEQRFERFGNRLLQSRKHFSKLKQSEIFTSELVES
jgi:hypothetical protein